MNKHKGILYESIKNNKAKSVDGRQYTKYFSVLYRPYKLQEFLDHVKSQPILRRVMFSLKFGDDKSIQLVRDLISSLPHTVASTVIIVLTDTPSAVTPVSHTYPLTDTTSIRTKYRDFEENTLYPVSS